jgi:hypothetical protein
VIGLEAAMLSAPEPEEPMKSVPVEEPSTGSNR